jgi:outer membrane biosynthesis protein TonB
MTRLRIRIELNRRMAGVPLDKMASVVEETRKFFYLLSQDVNVDADRGEWLASDFDAESLNFTAEYGGPVSAEQVQAFGAAFSGATSLRRATIAQFTRIADFLGEDELVGFGLYQSDQEPEPTEWRCLSKRDAMRFGEEIKLLAEAAGEQLQETQLPAVMNGSIAGRRLFKDRRERETLAADPSKVVRELESNLSRRIGLLEGEVAEQTRKMQQMQQISGNPEAAEEKFQKLLSAMETFWAQAPRQFPQLPAPVTAEHPVQVETPAPRAATTTEQPRGWTVLGVTIAASAAILFGLAFPEMQRQWVRFETVEIMPLVRPKPPEAPGLSVMTVQHKTTVQPVIQSVAARSSEPFTGPQIPLEVPANVKSKIQSAVQVDVMVAIDEHGNVTGAHVTSTKGDSAQLLVTEALRAARESRFRPAHEGAKTVQSRMVLSFLFKPESNEF